MTVLSSCCFSIGYRELVQHAGVHNLPIVDDVGAVLVDHFTEEGISNRDIRITGRNGRTQNIPPGHASLMALQYPIIYPYGFESWNFYLKKTNGKRITSTDFYRFYLQILPQQNPLFMAGKLFQQWLVDVSAQIEANNLNFYAQNQAGLRSEGYQVCIRDQHNNGI